MAASIDPERARARLEQELTDLDAADERLRAENAGDSGEITSYDQHLGDLATDVQDAGEQAALIEGNERQRRQIRLALQAIEDGSYGTCSDCGRPIPPERLEALPEATRCVDCQRRLEAEG